MVSWCWFCFEGKFNNPFGSHNVSSEWVQFPVLDGSILFLIRNLLNAYMNCKTFGLLFHPHLQQILLNSSSIWSYENLYARIYCNGQYSLDRYSCAIDTREWILNENHQITVLQWPSIRGFCLWFFSNNKYDNTFSHCFNHKDRFSLVTGVCKLLQMDSYCLTCQWSYQLVLFPNNP